MRVEIAERAGLVEPLQYPREVAHAGRVRHIVWQRPDPSDDWNELCLCVGERELDGLRSRRRLVSQQCGLEVEKGNDECFAIAQRCPLDQARLKAHPGFTEQPGLPLQPVD